MQLTQQGILMSGGRPRFTVASPLPITVNNGTAFGSIPLPSSVRAAYADGHYDDAPVTWSSTGYNSAVNGVYTISGIVNGTTINTTADVWVLAPATVHLDCRDYSLMTHSIDNLGRIITGVTGKSGSSATQTGTALLINRPSFNEEGIYFNTQGALVWGNTTSFNTFHSDTNWSVFAVWYQLPIGTTNNDFRPIISNSGGSSAETGFNLIVDNRSSASRAYALNCVVTKSVVGTPVINHFSANNAIVPNAWNWAEVKFDGTTFTMNVNGTSSTFVPVTAFAVGNASNAMSVGHFPALPSQRGNAMYLAHVYMINSHVTGATETLMQTWAAAVGRSVTPEPANVTLIDGQSNVARADNAGAAVDLQGLLGARIMVVKPTSPTSVNGSGVIDSESYWEQMDWEVNHVNEFVTFYHGFALRYGKLMWDYNKNCWIIQLKVGGTQLGQTASFQDWNPASSNELYAKYIALVSTGILELIHVYRKTPVVRIIISYQGESDSDGVGKGTTWKADRTTFINGTIDAIVGLGVTVNKARIVIVRVSGAGGYAYDATALGLVRTGAVEIGDLFLSENPARSANVKGSTWIDTDGYTYSDPQHIDAPSQDALGTTVFTYAKPHVNE